MQRFNICGCVFRWPETMLKTFWSWLEWSSFGPISRLNQKIFPFIYVHESHHTIFFSNILLFAWLGAAITAFAVCRFVVISHQNVNNKEIVSRWEQIKFIVMCTRYSFVRISMKMIFVHRANVWVCLFLVCCYCSSSCMSFGFPSNGCSSLLSYKMEFIFYMRVCFAQINYDKTTEDRINLNNAWVKYGHKNWLDFL